VVEKFVDELRIQLMGKNVHLDVEDSVTHWLMQKDFDPAYGARPLARTIEEQIKKPLVEDLLFERLSKGGKVKIKLKKDALSFEIESFDPVRV
jgi:ATP-dependent Clp protease ATP-binding subunit ClpA